jgi:hypothetical protein
MKASVSTFCWELDSHLRLSAVVVEQVTQDL